jgi:hypothetical protein
MVINVPNITKLVIHAMWILLSLFVWIAALKILNPMRVTIMEYSELCIAVVISGILGWSKKNNRPYISPVNVLQFVAAILLFSLADDYMILSKVYRFKEVFLPNVQLSEFFFNIWGFVLMAAALALNTFRKNHAKKISSDLFIMNTYNEAAQHRIYWTSMLFAAIALLPIIFFNFLIVSAN